MRSCAFRHPQHLNVACARFGRWGLLAQAGRPGEEPSRRPWGRNQVGARAHETLAPLPETRLHPTGRSRARQSPSAHALSGSCG